MYGVFDVGQAFVKSSGAAGGSQFNQGTVGRLDNNSSYIGFKGTEDLGNGLKAVFQYESDFQGDQSGAIQGGRDSYVGLTGGFGTIVAGTLTHPLRAMYARTEILPGATGLGSTSSVVGKLMGSRTGADDRAKNVVAYMTPKFAGFSGTVAYINGETKTNDTPTSGSVNRRAWQLAGQYENGPVWAALGYHREYDFGAQALSSPTSNGPVLGALSNADSSIWRAATTYTFPSNTKISALYDSTKAGLGGDTYAKRRAWSLGVTQAFGNNTVGLEYARAGDTSIGGSKQDNTGANIVTALYSYSLSKRTMLHARYSRLSNNDNVDYNFYVNPTNNGVATGTTSGTFGSTYTGYMVGIRHSF
ncbi:porin [Dechloromonas sp. ARDL1]|uniref:porin n=1 Tax=Dechloromonas sp. ARDL1 TaxID=3322121 RepID=UPI003DA7231F